jgi:hypothetical protein
MSGKHSVYSLQKAAVLGTSHIMKCYNMKLEVWVAGCTTGSWGEVPGERKHVMRWWWWSSSSSSSSSESESQYARLAGTLSLTSPSKMYSIGFKASLDVAVICAAHSFSWKVLSLKFCSSVGIALGYGLDDRGSIDSRRGLGIFLFTAASGTALGPTQPPIQYVPGALSLEVKRPGHEARHSIYYRCQRMIGAIPPLPQYTFMAWCLVKAQWQLYLYLDILQIHLYLQNTEEDGI